MNYMTPKEAAGKWDVSLRRVQFLCTNHRIPDIQFVNHRWLIPVNASYPNRSHKRNHESQVSSCEYHFPFFVFSDYYAAERMLNSVEKELLHAQMLMLQGKYLECLQLCSHLEMKNTTVAVRFGLYCTIVHASLPLGFYENVFKYMKLMEKLCQNDLEHETDYKLLICICNFQYTYNASALKDIVVSDLTPQALTAYECFCMQTTVFTKTIESEACLNLYTALCRNLEVTGNLPAAFIAHSFVALFYGRVGKTEEAEVHIDSACRIGCELKLYGLLTKHSSLNPDLYKKYISIYDSDFSRKLEHLRTDNQNKWRIVFNAAHGNKIFPDCSADDADFLMLLSYGLKNKTLAELKNIPVKEISCAINRLCVQYKMSTKAELVAYAKNIFSSLENSQ